MTIRIPENALWFVGGMVVAFLLFWAWMVYEDNKWFR